MVWVGRVDVVDAVIDGAADQGTSLPPRQSVLASPSVTGRRIAPKPSADALPVQLAKLSILHRGISLK